MKRNLFIVLLIIIVLFILLFINKEPKALFAKFTLGKTFNEMVKLQSPSSLIVNSNLLYCVIDSNINYIQALKINPDGSLTPKFSFGKQGKGLGEFGFPLGLAVKGNYLFVADSGNSRIQALKINPDGSLTPKFSFGKQGKGLGEFGGDGAYLTMLAIKGNFVYVADTGNNRIQALEIKY